MLGQIDGNHTSTQLALSHGVGREGEKGVGGRGKKGKQEVRGVSRVPLGTEKRLDS